MRDPFRYTTYLNFKVYAPTPLGDRSYRAVKVTGSLSYRYVDDVMVIVSVTVIDDDYAGSTEVAQVVQAIGEALLSAGATPNDGQRFIYKDEQLLPQRFYATAEATLSMVEAMEATYATSTHKTDFDGAVREIFEDHFCKLHNAMWIKSVAQRPVDEGMSDWYADLLRQHDVPHARDAGDVVRRLADVSKVRFEP